MIKKLLLFVSVLTLFIFYGGENALAESEEAPVIGADGEILSEEEQGVIQPEPTHDGEITPLIDQRPDAEVLLSNFTNNGGNTYSDYCTATQSHINIGVTPSSGGGTVVLQQRGPNEGWNDVASSFMSDYGYFNRNAVEGHDYRVRIETAPVFGSMSGVVTCW